MTQDARLYAACEPGDWAGRQEARVAVRAAIGVLDYCINTIKDPTNG